MMDDDDDKHSVSVSIERSHSRNKSRGRCSSCNARNCWIVFGVGELKLLTFWRDVFSEFLSTFILLTVQCSVVLKWGQDYGFAFNLGSALAMGFTVAILIENFAPFGGSHFNPAVTLGMAILRKLSIIKAFTYVLVQCLGALAGAGFVYSVTPGNYRGNLAVTKPEDILKPWQNVLVEMWMTFFFVITIIANTNSDRKMVCCPGIPAGLALTVGSIAGGKYTDGSMNPARSLGPAVIMKVWEDHWVYWVGPLLGGALAALVYSFLLDKIGHPRPNVTENWTMHRRNSDSTSLRHHSE